MLFRFKLYFAGIIRIIKALVTVYEKSGIFKFKLGLRDLVVVFKAKTVNVRLNLIHHHSITKNFGHFSRF